MIRVMIVDDHPALRAGLQTVLRREPGLVPCSSVTSAADAIADLRSAPDVVLADYRLPGRDGLDLCRELKRLPVPPRVLIYSAHATDALAIPARLAGADGMVNKAMPADALFEAIRAVAGGGSVFPAPRRDLLEAATAIVATEDLPILGMLQDDTPLEEAAAVLQLSPDAFEARLSNLIAVLRPPAEAA